MSPLDWVSVGAAACRDGVPTMMGAAGMQGVCKAHLQAGDHIYASLLASTCFSRSFCGPCCDESVGYVAKAWKLGWTYNLHGIVVHTQPCKDDCLHDTLGCCAVVRFKLPGAEPGRIELCIACIIMQVHSGWGGGEAGLCCAGSSLTESRCCQVLFGSFCPRSGSSQVPLWCNASRIKGIQKAAEPHANVT